jgi:hypothetical protein
VSPSVDLASGRATGVGGRGSGVCVCVCENRASRALLRPREISRVPSREPFVALGRTSWTATYFRHVPLSRALFPSRWGASFFPFLLFTDVCQPDARRTWKSRKGEGNGRARDRKFYMLIGVRKFKFV